MRDFYLAIRSLCDSDGCLIRSKGHAVAVSKQCTIPISTPKAVVDIVAIADIQFRLGAISPDRMLDKSRKGLRVIRIELPRVNVLRLNLALDEVFPLK